MSALFRAGFRIGGIAAALTAPRAAAGPANFDAAAFDLPAAAPVIGIPLNS